MATSPCDSHYGGANNLDPKKLTAPYWLPNEPFRQVASISIYSLISHVESVEQNLLLTTDIFNEAIAENSFHQS